MDPATRIYSCDDHLDMAAVPPMRARMTGAISLILWTAIIITGRTMAYSF